MYHRVTRHLTLAVGSSGTAIEFSRAVAMGDDNAVAVEVGLVAQDGSIDLVQSLLQGSNDGTTWTTIATVQFGTGSPGSVTSPDHKRQEVSGTVAWALVRNKYIVQAASTKNIQLWAGIETFKRG